VLLFVVVVFVFQFLVTDLLNVVLERYSGLSVFPLALALFLLGLLLMAAIGVLVVDLSVLHSHLHHFV